MKNHNDPSTTQPQSQTPVPTDKISVLHLTLKTLKFVKLTLMLLHVSGITVTILDLEPIQELVQALLDFIDVE